MEEMQPDVSSSRVVTVYKRLASVDEEKAKNYCWSKGFAPSKVQSIRVVSERVSNKFFAVSFVLLLNLQVLVNLQHVG